MTQLESTFAHFAIVPEVLRYGTDAERVEVGAYYIYVTLPE